MFLSQSGWAMSLTLEYLAGQGIVHSIGHRLYFGACDGTDHYFAAAIR
jgi:hypothetical protein